MELDLLRPGVVAAERRAFHSSLSVGDIENLYGDACVDALERRFQGVAELAAYVRRHVHNRAITLKYSPAVARRVAVDAGDQADAVAGPHEQAIQGEAVALLYEFMAEQCHEDRNVAWLLANGYRPAQIARRLEIPRAQATADCKRLRSSLERFVALQTRPAAICARRREDLLTWQRTGRMPLALRWHLRWHHGCALAVRDARQEVQHAVLPLVPAAAALQRVGLLQRAWQSIVTHRLVPAAHTAAARARRLAPAGGGSAAAGAGAVKAVAIIGAGVAAVHALAAAPAHHPHHAGARIVAHAASDTTSTPTVTSPIVATTPVPQSTTPTTTISSTSTTSTTTPATPVAPDSGASTPPSSSATTTTSAPAQQSASPASPSGDAATASAPSGGGGGGTGSSLGAGGTPP